MSADAEKTVYTWQCDSPLGEIYLAAEEACLIGLWFKGQRFFAKGLPERTVCRETPILRETVEALEGYFHGERLQKLPPLHPSGSAFQKSVWRLLLQIPYGQTSTYGALSEKLCAQGICSSARAVGNAVGQNPISVLIPCHRVLGADGTLTGYAGGLERKKWLLQHEKESALNV